MSKSKKGNNSAQSPQRQKKECTALLVIPKPRDCRRATLRMNVFVREYERQCGNISATCVATGVSRRTYYRWMSGEAPIHRRFQKKILRILPGERLVDAAESVLLHHLQQKDLTAAIFTAKTQGRTRGWNERIDIFEPVTIDPIKEQLMQVRAAIERRAAQKEISFVDELKNFLEIKGADIRPEIKEQLVSELEQ